MIMQVRMTDEQHKAIKKRSIENGFESVSAYVKYVSLNAKVVATVPKVGTVKKKKCGSCGQMKSYDEFYKDNSNKTDGLQGHCKECRTEYNRKK